MSDIQAYPNNTDRKDCLSWMSDSRRLNCSQSTTTRWAVSNEGQDCEQYVGVEKKAPIRLTRPMGAATGVNLHAHPTDSLMQTQCQQKNGAEAPQFSVTD